MNKTRRKALARINERIEELRSELETLLEEEEECLDNIPENLQGSEHYEIAEAALSNLSDAYETLDEVHGLLADIIDGEV